MRAKWILVMLMLMVFSLAGAGCDSFLPGMIAGAAGQETVESWKENLEAKKAELQKQYDQALAELQSAPDPNTAALAREKLTDIQNVKLVTEGALLVAENLLTLPEYKDKTLGQRQDMLITALLSAGIITWRELQKRKLKNKYVSMKVGKHDFEVANPEAAKDLHLAIGRERINRNL